MNDIENTLSNTKKRITKTKVALWLLVVPYIIFTVCMLIIEFGGNYLDLSTELQFVAFVFLYLYPSYATGLTIASAILQMISIFKGEEKLKNILMLIFSVLSLLFICFYYTIFDSYFENMMNWE